MARNLSGDQTAIIVLLYSMALLAFLMWLHFLSPWAW